MPPVHLQMRLWSSTFTVSIFNATLMLKFFRLLTEQTYWLSPTTDNLLSTPYSRIANIQLIISPYSIQDGTSSEIVYSNDGQTAEYSHNGIIRHTVDYRKWHHTLQALTSEIMQAVSAQMPSNTSLSDFMNFTIVDDFSAEAPHRQKSNEESIMKESARFQVLMKSPTDHHHLFQHNGSLNTCEAQLYIQNDQEIRRLLSALFACSSGVTLRPWQFGSIVFDSCEGYLRNVWVLGNRFMAAKPKAKQRNLAFGETALWLPQQMTQTLGTLFYLQQPFIATTLLEEHGPQNHLYASHVWALPSKRSRKVLPMAWNGQEINKAVRDITKRLLGCPLDPPLIRQLAEGLLRDKIPRLFEIWQDRSSSYLSENTYLNTACLHAYANKHGLQALVSPEFGIMLDKAAACLIIVDIWQCMHGIVAADPVWQPMVEGSYIFPTTTHDALAYDLAQNLKDTKQIRFSKTIDQHILTQCITMCKAANTSVRTGKLFIKTLILISYYEKTGRASGRIICYRSWSCLSICSTVCLVW